jgi:hypothetical protein
MKSSVHFALHLIFGCVIIQLQSFAVFPVQKLFLLSKNVLGRNKSSSRLWSEAKEETQPCDIWIVGGGILGELIGLKYREKYPLSKVICETLTTSRHSQLISKGFEVRLRAERKNKVLRDARKLVICIPPSSAYQGRDYVAEVNEAVSVWRNRQLKVSLSSDLSVDSRQLLLISSVGVYGEFKDIQMVNENSKVDRESARLTRSAVVIF